ncbi:hypothetical protein B0H14DRAFT_2564227 [Mycena olivaceomarginata]|nr:hypothetical protein B0H14DRAFT_2564227 [Mycena olivaceomarginata]
MFGGRMEEDEGEGEVQRLQRPNPNPSLSQGTNQPLLVPVEVGRAKGHCLLTLQPKSHLLCIVTVIAGAIFCPSLFLGDTRQLNAFFDIQRLLLCPCLLTHPLSSCNFRDNASPTVCLPTQDTKSEVGIQVSRPLYGGSNNLQPTTMSQDSNLDLDTSLSQLVLHRGVISTCSNLFPGD